MCRAVGPQEQVWKPLIYTMHLENRQGEFEFHADLKSNFEL